MLRSEIQAFFVLDTCKCVSEYDDPKDAILYFYPPQVPESYQCTLSCQVMGVVQFYTSFFSFPKMICLESGKFAVIKCERQYLLFLGGLSDTSDYLLSKCLDFMYGLFTFYHHSISSVHSDPDFANKLKRILNGCVDATFTEDRAPPSFVVLPWLQTAETSLYLSASHIVQSCRRYPGFLAGCVFHKGELVFTQLEPNLTQFLCCFQHQRSAANAICLPKIILFLNVYVNRMDLSALMDKHLPKSEGNAGGPKTTVGRSSSVSEDYETPSTNLESEVSSAETLDSLNYLSSTEDVQFSNTFQTGFCESFESSLQLIHKVTHDSLEKLNRHTDHLKPRRKKKSVVSRLGSSHNECSNLLKPKSVPNKSKSNLDGSCDSSFFDSQTVVHPNYDLAKKYHVIPTMHEIICQEILTDLKRTKKSDLLDINSIISEKEILLVEPVLQFPKGSPWNAEDPSKLLAILEQSKEPMSESQRTGNEMDAKRRSASFDSSSLRTVRESVSPNEDDSMSKLDLFVLRHSDTDLYLLMNDGASNNPSLIGEIHKDTEKCTKKLNESLVRGARLGKDGPSKASRSFLVDNCWHTQTGDPGPDDQGVSWVTMKEDFHSDPTLKCATVSNLKGTTYAHSSVTHQVFSSMSGCYTPGIPDAQDAAAKISTTFPKQMYNKLGYYLLK